MPVLTKTHSRLRKETFDILPIKNFVRRWTADAKVIVDPFARNSLVGTHRNDLDPSTTASSHEEATAWLRSLDVVADAVILDPPYSPRQISESYRGFGRSVSQTDTQNAVLYSQCKDLLAGLLREGGVALTFGWNSNGFGAGRGFVQEEILLVSYGAAHNDTICVAERKICQK